MVTWYLIAMHTYHGLALPVTEYTTEAACKSALQYVKAEMGGADGGKYVKGVCVKNR